MRRPRRSPAERGQVLVEFSLVFIIFFTLFIGVIEFGFAFGVNLQVGFAARDAAAVASESGSSPNAADGAVLGLIDNDLSGPGDRNRVDHVDIFWADANGNVQGGAIQRYTPNGPLYPGHGGWNLTMSSYPASARCGYIGGYGCLTGHTGPDHIGVTIVYRYSWITPLPSLLPTMGSGATYTQTSLTTMEPIPAPTS